MKSDLETMADVLTLNRERPRKPIPLVVINRELKTTELHQVMSAVGPIFVFFSEEIALQACAGVHWHDDPEHCRTWTDGGGCACDVEGVDCSPPRAPPATISSKPIPVELLQQLGLGGPALVLEVRRPPPAPHDPKTCPRCIARAAQAFGPNPACGIA